MVNRTSLGQIISTAVFYGVAFLIFLKGMELQARYYSAKEPHFTGFDGDAYRTKAEVN